MANVKIYIRADGNASDAFPLLKNPGRPEGAFTADPMRSQRTDTSGCERRNFGEIFACRRVAKANRR
ncbi:hypothetical protein EYF80_047782 [Liparis tanakae]|uniref:Uncharacterized protein n=1 Tax=Liparis tanakae TaxID=230148 RepID=A0A4Z2FM91_9TELE|nr:hypothetical protein EYF80_047782 [Liparis tanakae]